MKNNSQNILTFLNSLNKPIFTTHDLVAHSGKSTSNVIQCLNRLVDKEVLIKLRRGVWAKADAPQLSAFNSIFQVFPRQRVYVSFISALHLHGIIEQIPQVISLASTAHTSRLQTKLGSFTIHQIASELFDGFDWYKGTGDFLIAEPEKALIDCLYLSSRRKKNYRYFPELYFSKEFSFKKAKEWGKKIPDEKIRNFVMNKLKTLAKDMSQA